MNDVVSKRYYRIKFTLASALSLSSGENKNSDRDLLLDSRGLPFIPASSLAGVYRCCLDEKNAETYFGKRFTKEGHSISESELLVYDANLAGDQKPVITIRDGIKVDEYKTAINGSKYDYEILEPGCSFVCYVEHNKNSDSVNIFDEVAAVLLCEDLSFGGKTSRGLGRIKDVEIKTAEFAMNGNDLDRWLDFDMYEDKFWADKPLFDFKKIKNDHIKISVSIKQKSALSIREYRTEVGEEKSLPDQQQMAYVSTDGYKPVIPGTSWNGIFRHALQNYGCTKIDDLFGESGHRSAVTILETTLDNAVTKTVSRNAIDRFTGGTVKNALFTETSCYNGGGILTLLLPPYKNEYEQEYKGICCAIADLHAGLLALGGETSIGHGLFEISSVAINDEKITEKGCSPEIIYSALCEKLLDREVKND